MNQINRAPIVKVLHAIRPIQAGSKLAYPNLERAVTSTVLFDRYREMEFYANEPDSLDEEKAAKELAKSYFLQTVSKLIFSVDTDSEQIWADRMTKAAIELYGEPDFRRANDLLKFDYDNFIDSSVPEYLEHEKQQLIEFYKRFCILDHREQIESSETRSFTESLANTQELINHYLINNYEQVFEFFDTLPNNKISPKQVVEFFTLMLTRLYDTHPELVGWKASLVENSDTIFTNDETKTIEVGINRASCYPAQLKGIFLHEVVAHATRATLGNEINPMLGKGLPNYLAFEEGIGGIIEYSITDIMPYKISDRYTDIAIALGLNGNKIVRSELIKFATLRAKIRKFLDSGDSLNSDDEAEIVTHVNRIYRGSNGNDVVGVFTKDISYFVGFEKAVNYIDRNLQSGYTIQDIMDYILEGRFDPEDYTHVRYRGNNNLKDKL